MSFIGMYGYNDLEKSQTDKKKKNCMVIKTGTIIRNFYNFMAEGQTFIFSNLAEIKI